jgi:hypothetical protein
MGLAAGAFVLLRIAPAAIRAVRALHDSAMAQTETLAKVEDLLVREPVVRDSLVDVVRGIVALAPDLVDGETSADAQASLSSLLSLAANRHSLKVVRVDPLPDSAVGVFGTVALHAELEGDLASVTGMVGGLESGAPLLTLTSVAIDAPDPLPHPRSPEALHVALDVQGYYLRGRDKR